MSRRYTPEEKTAIMQTLAENGGNVARTSTQTGVPVRTLHAWRAQEQGKLPKHLLMDDPEFEAILRRDAEHADAILDDVLKQLLESVRVLAGRINTNFDHVPPTTQMMALSRLIDRILKLEARQPRIEQPHAIIIRYQDDDGSFHRTPYWMRSADDEEEEDGGDSNGHDGGGHDNVVSLRERW
jgi:transposase-like protein